MTKPEWWRSAVIYQIYPRSFLDRSGDGVGDLSGVLDRLDHLRGAESSLGVDALWLSPFYRSPMSDFGYDISDHCDVDPIFGSLADIESLIEAAHGRGLRVLLDLVPNHTSEQHPWFIASRSSRTDPKRDWYVWRDGQDGRPPNNWMAEFRGIGSAWSLDATTGQWYLHSFQPSQPDLNWDNPEVEGAIHDVMRFWLARGVDGFRIDVVHKIGKAPDLRDNAGIFVGPVRGDRGRRFDEDWPTAHERIRRMRSVATSFGAVVLVGEVYLLDADQMSAYISTGDELDLAHNFEFLTLPWDAAAFRRGIGDSLRQVGPIGWPSWCLNNHDHRRVASRYPGEGAARVAAMLLLTLRGTPFLYQGEELGLLDGNVPPDRVVDIDGRDPSRCPIPWVAPSDRSPFAGFSEVEPWLPIGADASVRNVATEAADPDSVLSLYRRLIAVRSSSVALRAGEFELFDERDGLVAYRRSHGAERFIVILNFEASPSSLAWLADRDQRRYEVVIDTRRPHLSTAPIADSIPGLTGWLIRERDG